MATLYLLSLAASLLGSPTAPLEGASFTTPAYHHGIPNTVTGLQRDLTHAPVFRLLYGAPGNAAVRVEAFLHFYSPIKSQSEDHRDASRYFRLLRTC
ncbi:hypothetical protein [Verrucomicrobium sp. BvORR034]|uniref:hypothetical protein n=1 Tax=Verrucomicrobium sp. BvORR034 TaxID=1396418 RepID=UPI000678D574|nr:hypothetical protein [Verrucomicrobium sp. BvORR034]